MGARENIFPFFPNRFFVETGSYVGTGIERALAAGFPSIISIELSEKYFSFCTQKFAGFPQVKVMFGDSALVLAEVISAIEHPITFWLDGHHSCGDTALGLHWAPLMQELEQIRSHRIKTHTLLIDDMRCWQEPNPTHGFSVQELIPFIYTINPNYKLSYLDGEAPQDILVATP
jgi:hypothetical protein